MSYAIQMIRSGRQTDPECSRSSSRLRGTWTILAGWGVSPALPGHADHCARHADHLNAVAFSYRGRVCCSQGCPHYAGGARPTLPEWLTDDLILQAYRLADALQETRGAWHRREAYAAKAAASA